MNEMEVSESAAVRFLVVDDSRAIQSIIRRTLEAGGFPGIEIRVASDVDTAWQTLEAFEPDLIITDWHMPKMTGLDFLKKLRMDGRQTMPVGFVTTESNPAKINEARLHGAAFVVNKPFDDQKFLEAVKVALTRESSPEMRQEISSVGFILSPDHGRSVLGEICPGASLTLEPALPILPSFLTAHNLLGLYGFGGQSQPVAALAVLDMKAVAILWGTAHDSEVGTVQAMSAASDVEDDILVIPRRFMELVAPKILVTPDKPALELTRSSIVAQGFRRLHELMQNREGRADFTLTSGRYGSGHITLLMV